MEEKKQNKVLLIASILAVIFFSISIYQAINPRIEYEEILIPGKKDTITEIQKVEIPVYHTIYDTVFNDTSKIDSNVSESFSTTFSHSVDTNTGVSGEVSFKRLRNENSGIFEISIKELWYPKETISITQIDTLLKTVEVEQPFYDTFEFGFGSGLSIFLIIYLLIGK